MCGVAGIVGPAVAPGSELLISTLPRAGDHTTTAHVRAVERMVDALVHRGPDARRVATMPGAALGSARLAVVDAPLSHQPLASGDGHFVLAFNGEILNYEELRAHPAIRDWTWRTRGDTEVLLALLARLGPAALMLLNGQFAGALWDARRGRLLLFRDRMGIAPLYFAPRESSLAFASTIGALLTLGGIDTSIDPLALRQLYTFWAPHPPNTMCRGIKQLPPASYALVHHGRMELKRYWEPAFTGTLASTTDADKAELLREALLAATRRALQADERVGALVSGGLDSAGICGLASREAARIPSFSMTFDDPLHDESRFQTIVATANGTDHHTVRCTPGLMAAALPDVVAHAGTPFMRFAPAAAYLMSAAIREAEIKVVLSGEGADELFCGYDLFKEVVARGDTPGEAPSVSQLASSGVGGTPAEQIPARVLALMMGKQAGADPRFVAHRMRWNGAQQASTFVRPELLHDAGDATDLLHAELPSAYASWSQLERAQCVELRTLLPDYVLATQGDRMLMAHSIEGRFPFLDNTVVDFALAVGDEDKLRGSSEKFVVRQALADVVPQAILDRHKQAYRAPVGDVLCSDAGQQLVGATLDPEVIRRHDVFDVRKVDWLKRRVLSGHPLSNVQDMALAAVVTTGLWVDFVGSHRHAQEDIAA
jgi:asparagine synthase (glutamine-hydrolysing)